MGFFDAVGMFPGLESKLRELDEKLGRRLESATIAIQSLERSVDGAKTVQRELTEAMRALTKIMERRP